MDFLHDGETVPVYIIIMAADARISATLEREARKRGGMQKQGQSRWLGWKLVSLPGAFTNTKGNDAKDTPWIGNEDGEEEATGRYIVAI